MTTYTQNVPDYTPIELQARRLRSSAGRHTFDTRDARWLDMPSLASDIYRAAAHLGGQHRKGVDLSKPVSLAKRIVPNTDTLIRSGL